MKTPRPPCTFEAAAWPPSQTATTRPPGRKKHLWIGSDSPGEPQRAEQEGLNPDRIPRVCGFPRAASALTRKSHQKGVFRDLPAGDETKGRPSSLGDGQKADPPEAPEPEPAPTRRCDGKPKTGRPGPRNPTNRGVSARQPPMGWIIEPRLRIVKQGGVRRGRNQLHGLETAGNGHAAGERAAIGHHRHFRRDSCDPLNR